MDFTFYKNFITIAETGNLTLAAKKLNLAQPALSSQLKQLENYYGVKLIETKRGKRAISLTEAGTDFLLKAQQICMAEENLLLNMQSFQSKTRGTLRFSISPAAVSSFMDQYLLPFSKENPDISYVMVEETVEEQVKNIRKGNIDFAYANAPLPDMKNLACHQVRTERFYAVYHHSMVIKKQESLSLKDLQNYPLSCNRGCYGLLRQLCEQNGFLPNVKLLSTTGPAAAHFACSGDILAIVSDDCSRNLPPGLQRIPISDPDFFFNQTIFWSTDREMTPPLKSFLAFLSISK